METCADNTYHCMGIKNQEHIYIQIHIYYHNQNYFY